MSSNLLTLFSYCKFQVTRPYVSTFKAQWNTTYLMLLAALDYNQAFTMLEKSNDNYNQSPSAVDWEEVEVACRYLKL